MAILKDAFYFPHFAGARNDRKVKRLRKELHAEGYGIYFMILEILRDQANFRYPMDDLDLLADDIESSEQKVRTVICNYGLFQVDENNCFWSPKFVEFLSPYLEKSERAKEAARIRWDREKSKLIDSQQTNNANAYANAMPPQCPSNADQNAKRIKENKIKEKKESSNRQTRSSFSKPSQEDVNEYFSEKLNAASGEHPAKFFNYYEANGWRVGKNPMKDWKAAIRNWISNINKYPGNGFNTTTVSNQPPTGPKLGTSAARMEAGRRWVETGSTKPATGQDLFS